MEIERELLLESPPDEVWEALTDPERLEKWFANEVAIDPTPGGYATFCWSNGEVRRAVIEDIELERRLVLRWLDDEGVVFLELTPAESGTVLRVVETSPEFTSALQLQALAACAVA